MFNSTVNNSLDLTVKSTSMCFVRESSPILRLTNFQLVLDFAWRGGGKVRISQSVFDIVMVEFVFFNEVWLRKAELVAIVSGLRESLQHTDTNDDEDDDDTVLLLSSFLQSLSSL